MILVAVCGVVLAGIKNLSRLAPAFLAPVLVSVFFILVGIWSSSSRDLEGDGISGISIKNLKDNWPPVYHVTDDNGIPKDSSLANATQNITWSFQVGQHDITHRFDQLSALLFQTN